MAEIKYNLGNLGVIPSGVVMPFAGSTAPTGYLLCDGSEVSRIDYPFLFSVIGTTYGEGDGSTTFNLPNLKDKFIEGAGTNAVGTEMSAGLPNITGRIGYFPGMCVWTGDGNGVSGAFNRFDKINVPINNVSTSGNSDSYYYDFDASLSNSIYGNSTTVQPPALVMNYIIKY